MMSNKRWIVLFVVLAVSLPSALAEERSGFWLDLYFGEPVEFESIIDDLSQVQVVYLGEAHRVARHHQLQRQIVQSLVDKGKKILLCIEQLEQQYQPQADRFNRKEIDFDTLAEETQWSERWNNYTDYQPLLEAVLASGGRAIAANAREETIHNVGRNGIEGIRDDERKELPKDLNFDEPLYEKWLKKQLLVHMPFSDDMLWKVYQAQVARDETMSRNVSEAWKALDDPENWIAVVVCGSGHCNYGLGTVSRVLRRLPDAKDRIVLMTESGDTVLSEQEKAMARDIEITHEDVRFLNRPIADYLYAFELNPNREE